MLGPELLNMTVRPTPIFLEGTASLRIDQPGPRLGLPTSGREGRSID